MNVTPKTKVEYYILTIPVSAVPSYARFTKRGGEHEFVVVPPGSVERYGLDKTYVWAADVFSGHLSRFRPETPVKMHIVPERLHEFVGYMDDEARAMYATEEVSQ